MHCAPSNVGLVTTAPIPAQVSRSRSFNAYPEQVERSFLTIVTSVLWLFCVLVGSVGLSLAYARPAPVPPAVAPVQAEFLNVTLAQVPLSTAMVDPLPNDTRSLPGPPPVDPIALPPTVPLMAVAAPTPAVLFPLPVEGPHLVVAPEQAAHSVPASSQEPQPSTPITVITYGAGEGRQPAPSYPRQSIREGQEGVVTVRFSVGTNGRVLDAKAVAPSPWPLLNEAAVRVIKERWRFAPGPGRLYEVAVRFELKH